MVLINIMLKSSVSQKVEFVSYQNENFTRTSKLTLLLLSSHGTTEMKEEGIK
jgi:hypothetical protein